MSNPIAIFYHCLFVGGNPPEFMPNAYRVAAEQMVELKRSGLAARASQIIVGVNGFVESVAFADALIPKQSNIVYHGLESRSECLTLVELEKWLPTHQDWYVLYFHCKGATHDPNSPYGQMVGRWRRCMMKHLVGNWQRCVIDLNSGFESVGCHWLSTVFPNETQTIWGGNFWWAKASYLSTLPSIFNRERIKLSGIAALESRYEAEVWIGNGPRLPRVKDYHPNGLGQCP